MKQCDAAGFQDAGTIPTMIVFMGNFSARATPNSPDADYVGLREGFTQLARLIDTYSHIKVPGASAATAATAQCPHSHWQLVRPALLRHVQAKAGPAPQECTRQLCFAQAQPPNSHKAAVRYPLCMYHSTEGQPLRVCAWPE